MISPFSPAIAAKSATLAMMRLYLSLLSDTDTRSGG